MDRTAAPERVIFQEKLNGSLLLMSLLLGVVAFVVLVPLFLMILNSFQVSKPGEPMIYGLQGWREAFSSPGILSAIHNTFSLALARQFIDLIFVIVLAWLFALNDFHLSCLLE